MRILSAFILSLSAFAYDALAQSPSKTPRPLSPIDFSHAGYAGGGVPLPTVAARYHVDSTGNDDTLAIQGALDAAGALPLDEKGFRAAVVLRPTTYKISGQLRLSKSGVVLRGNGATLIATGKSRGTLISVGSDDSAQSTFGPSTAITEDAPVGSVVLKVDSLNGLSGGKRISIRRPSTKEWIASIAMDQFTGSFKDQRLDWHPGSRDLIWDRTIVALDSSKSTITLDAPITASLEKAFGGGFVSVVEKTGRIENVGIENVTCVSEFDPSNPADEEHAWICLSLDQVENAWIRDVTARHFVSAAVWVGSAARAITVTDVSSERPVSENAGWRRHAFYTRGQQVLFLRCRAQSAREAFAAGLNAAGPNVFLECSATNSLAASGSFESWSTGTLFDLVTVDGAALELGNLGGRGQGAGWNAGNSVIWNCRADDLRVASPPGAPNSLHPSPASTDSKATPPPQPATGSLYREQLTQRRGAAAVSAVLVRQPAPSAVHEDGTGPAKPALEVQIPPAQPFEIKNGLFIVNGTPLFSGASSNAWWKGQTVPARAAQLGFHPMRWSPGLNGRGLTENLPALVKSFLERDARLIQLWPGLWYDRRRDDHTTVERADAEVWPPFYEMPWARSGQGKAADGLSRYDLTRFNPWYFYRLKTFTRLAAAEGIIVYYHAYNHHNLVEAAAHWADFPWRAANCLQETGFAEPPAYQNNGKRVGIVAEFYDVSHPVRRDLHRRYIRQCLDTLQDSPNVIHTAAFQFAGPLSFQRFYLETVREWQNERGKRVHVALNTSKTITDAVLKDAALAPLVDVVDQRYWQYLADGTLFAPHTDGDKAFRENRAEQFGKDAVPHGTFETVYKQVREYRELYPNKAIITPHAGQGPLPILLADGAWALIGDFAASQPLRPERDDRALFAFLRDRVGASRAELRPLVALPVGVWGLGSAKKWLLYSVAGDAIELPTPLSGKNFEGWWFDPRNGASQPVTSSTSAQLRKPTNAPWLLWIVEK